MKNWLMIVALCLMVWVQMASAELMSAPAGFDPNRHMRVDEVKPGMKGYGLSVFKGTQIDRFEVEVLSVLHNFNPKHDVVLIRCKGANLEHTGSIAGMSGSPIYLQDEKGRYRMIGAFAYGWPLMKDPIAGVQPIEYMIAIPEPKNGNGAATTQMMSGGNSNLKTADTQAMEGRSYWSLDDSLQRVKSMMNPANPQAGGMASLNQSGVSDGEVVRLQPLATPLMTSGLSPRFMEQFGGMFKSCGLVPLQAGTFAGSAVKGAPAAKLEPGAVLAVPLLSGDLEMTAIGTCTEVLGDRVLGFGHPFTSEGPISLPMGSGEVNGIIANLMTSFKLGALTQTRGTLDADHMVGIAGHMGKVPATIPIDLRVVYADKSEDMRYHFNAAVHPRFTPMITGAALAGAITGSRDLPQYHTLNYDLTMKFANGRELHIANTSVNPTAEGLFYEIALPMVAASENPFERVTVKQISGTINVIPEAREAQLLSVNLPREKYRPGETVKAYVTYRPFRAGESILPVEMELPRDLPDGTYQLVISDWERFFQDERNVKPFRFTAQSIEDVFAVLKDVTSIRHDAVYMRLMRQADGVAVGRTAMPYLPSSRRQVLMASGRSNTTPFVSSTVKTVLTPLVMNGSAEFAITIDKNAKVEVGGKSAVKHEGKESMPVPVAPKGDGKPGKSEVSPGGNVEPQG